MPDIRDVTAADTYALRRAVLRPNLPEADVRFPEDEVEGAFHLAAFTEGDVVGVASFSPSPTDLRPGTTAWQLRGMAVTPALQGQGLGALLINEAVDRIFAAGATVLWCHARDTASGFYDRLGFVTYGEGFRTVTTGLPHHVMLRDL